MSVDVIIDEIFAKKTIENIYGERNKIIWKLFYL